jgi:hypothetical protein
MKRSFLIIVLFFQVILLHGQTLKIAGIVTNEQGSPLKSVNIYLARDNQSGTSTSADGAFNIECKESDTLIFSHIAYFTRRLPITVARIAPDPLSLTIILQNRPVSLEPVTITEKHDHSFRYLLDFELMNEQILKLEILGRDKYLALYSAYDQIYWKCLLPDYLNKCNRLGRDFLSNIYLHSADTLYQLVADTCVCQILPGIPRLKNQYIMEPCIGMLSNGILMKRYGGYQQSVTLFISSKNSRKVVYSQEDVLARMHLSDLDNIAPAHAGLGFKVTLPERMNNHPASLSRQHQARGSGRGASSGGISKPISVESFCIDDTIYIFDHFVNQLFIYDKQGELLKTSAIKYDNKEFEQKYLLSDHNDFCYAVFKNRKGIYLLPVDYRTGQVSGPAKSLEIQFFEKVRIIDNLAIYMQYDHLLNKRRIVKSTL